MAEPLYSHYEDQAAEHLFSVAAGIDSMVLGEPHILAQVRAAFRAAEAEAATGPELEALFRRAIRAGRRARAETAIGASPAAFVEAGAVLAAEHLDRLEGRTLVVVGAGTMAELAARALSALGVGEVTVVSRTPAKAARLAAHVGASHRPVEELSEAVADADLVVSSTDSTGLVLSRPMLQRVGGRPLFVLDLAVPRDVDPAAANLPGIRVCDIDDLRAVLARSRDDASDEVAAVRQIVAEETRRFVTARRARRLAPLIEALLDRGERIRDAEVRRLATRLAGLPGPQREAVDLLTQRIVKRLLHDPVVRLKDLAGSGAADGAARTLADLFGLDED
jgi:glutamyl-tRNA reductase